MKNIVAEEITKLGLDEYCDNLKTKEHFQAVLFNSYILSKGKLRHRIIEAIKIILGKRFLIYNELRKNS